MSPSDYTAPVVHLLSLGQHPSLAQSPASHWLNYPQQFGLTLAHRAELLRLATAPAPPPAAAATPAAWAPHHAWRSLGQLGCVEAVLPLFQCLDRDHAARLQDFAPVCQLIGYAAIAPLLTVLADRQYDWWQRTVAIEALVQIGLADEAAHHRCVGAIASQLEQYQRQNPSLNAHLIAALIDLRSVEYLRLIEQAFQAKKVDLSVSGDWQDVQAYLGVIPQSELQQRRYLAAQAPVLDFRVAAQARARKSPGGKGFGGSDPTKKPSKKKP